MVGCVRATVVGLLVVAAALVGQPAGSASFPRENGNIAFSSTRDGNDEIYVMGADGSDPTRLTDNDDANDREPSWSPDGTRIAFTSNRDDGNSEIYVMGADGSDPTRLTRDTAYDSEPSWSPDGTRIAFTSNRDDPRGEVYVMGADGSDPTRLTDNGDAYDREPSWSPDGTRIAFTSNRDDGNFEIYVMGADGSDPTRLTDDTGYDSEPSWSPDGTRIAFATSRDGVSAIFVMETDGSGQTRLTPADDVASVQPTWSPDGTKIAFTRSADGSEDIYVMDADGSDSIRLTADAASDRQPSWQTTPGDEDGDGVPDVGDLCPGTVLPDAPTIGLTGARFAAAADGSFDSAVDRFDGRYTITDTAGCSGSQIIERLGLGEGHTKHGISKGALDAFRASIS